MPINEEMLCVGRERLLKIYHYLEALNQHRNPVKRLIQEQSWVLCFKDLPNHPSITRGEFIFDYSETDQINNSNSNDDFIIKVRRPRITEPPSPPDLIGDWLESGWKNPESEIKVKESQNKIAENGETIIEHFDEKSERVAALKEWQEKWRQWAKNEKPARQAMKLFERFYELYGRIQKEAERIEIVLGDGILYWRREESGVNHPVLLQRLQLDFNPNIPEFVITETDHEVELYSALFRSMPDVDGQVIARCREELKQGAYHPLGGDDTSGFLKRMVIQLSPHGEYLENETAAKDSGSPQISRDPVIFIRDRIQGFGVALEAILEDIKTREDIPKSLFNICGIEAAPIEEIEIEVETKDFFSEPEEILLGKPANPEQIEIAKSIEQHDGVLVQGPPGTGKTHTIANLIGHFLAHGKSILVTSQTTKALRVLREQVEEEIRSLCVSVLESDSNSRKQLEDSIEGIVQRLSSSNVSELNNTAKRLAEHRKNFIKQLKEIRLTLIEARTGEYRDLIIGGVNYAPSEAARKVAVESEINAWIPRPVTPGVLLPLTESEFIELYRTNTSISKEDENELGGILPNPGDLLMPNDFVRLLSEIDKYSKLPINFREELWNTVSSDVTPDDLETFLNQLNTAVDNISDEDSWKFAILHAGYKGTVYCEPWECLISMIEEIQSESIRCRESYLRFQPVISDYESLEKQLEIVSQILTYLENSHSLNALTLVMHPNWKKFISNSKIKGKEPVLCEHFQTLRDQLHLAIQRIELKSRWELQLTPLGVFSSNNLGEEPEIIANQFCGTIRICLDWHSKVWSQFEFDFEKFGFQWKVLLEESPQNLSPYGEIIRLKETVCGSLRQVLSARINLLHYKNLISKFEQLENVLIMAGDKCPKVVNALRQALKTKDPDAYEKSFQRLVDLYQLRSDLSRREELLGRLEKDAPSWAKEIRLRIGVHGEGKVPGDVRVAWIWRQIYDELENRSQLSLVELQDKIERLAKDIQQITTKLIETKAWAAQIERTGLTERLALTGYSDLMKKIGSGTGKRAPRLRAEARQKMSECRTAVPVWIMPLSRLAENFDPKTTRFDVVIIDEASQCDVMGLIAIYLAKKVIIVGDHEQVSPLAIGQKLDEVQHLIDEYLQGIPNYILYDGQRSVYDLARSSFGGTICLLEHFRCASEIIQFSNYLSYNGRIKPLRDSSSIKIKPPVIPYRVTGASMDDKTNHEEARTIVSLILASIEQPEYKDKTFGVISLLGDEQAMIIERLLRTYLTAEEYSRRNIICGNSANFQGDERDIMFLSLVYSPVENPPLRSLDAGFLGMYQKRYNVAASRAKEQMWVVYSLDPRVDLKPGDLRRNLIEHAEDPYAITRELEEKGKRTQSPFEKEVLKRLIQAGFRVTPQWKVGAYSIDLVIEGAKGNRLAVECDGDRYHPIEKIGEDMLRQALLERLGWTFIRIRGSHFFRNPDNAMKVVFQRLKEMDIEPVASVHNESAATEENALTKNIIRRATEMRNEWENSEMRNSKFEDKNQETEINNHPTIKNSENYFKPKRNQPTIVNDSKAKNSQINLPIRLRFDNSKLVKQEPEIVTDSRKNLVKESTLNSSNRPILNKLATQERASDSFDLITFFRQKNIEIVDKRSIGGTLWVIGGGELSLIFDMLKDKGYRFKLFEKGVISTNNRPAWSMTNMKKEDL